MMAETPQNASPARFGRRWRQFSLRTLLVFVLLVSALLSWITTTRYRHEHAAAELRKLGVTICYLHDLGDTSSWRSSPLLTSLLGEDLVRGACQIYGWRSSLTDESLSHVMELSEVKNVFLEDRPITDAGLKRLTRRTEITWLLLDGTQITDSGLEHLARLAGLRDLRLARTRVTDAGLERLGTPATLNDLYLSDTQITDRGLEHLQALPNLRGLNLDNTRITDRGLEHLSDIPSLQIVSLQGTKVTAEGVQRLRRALPGGNVVWQPTKPAAASNGVLTRE